MATAPQNGVKLMIDRLFDLKSAIAELRRYEVLVGFPEDTTERQDAEAAEITNASLGYIHDNGAPEANIPARPFMEPGIMAAREKIQARLFAMALATLRGGGKQSIHQGYHAVGLIAQAALRAKINEGIEPPLSERTLRARAAKGRKGAKKELERRAKGQAPSTAFAKPLIDSAQMRNAINYVVRDRKNRKK